jgi:hypothetical protein
MGWYSSAALSPHRSAFSSVDVHVGAPGDRACATRQAESGILDAPLHLGSGVDKGSKGIPSNAPHEILKRHDQRHVPRVAGLGERDTAARVPQRFVDERASVGIAAHDPIERD